MTLSSFEIWKPYIAIKNMQTYFVKFLQGYPFHPLQAFLVSKTYYIFILFSTVYSSPQP